MQKNITHSLIKKAIQTYAEAYALIESVQSLSTDAGCFIPKGDQKTGCIGEYWAMRYARKKWGEEKCMFGNHSQHGWDIKVVDTDIRIQVKTVSGWSEKKQMSPIDSRTERREIDPKDWAPWTFLWLIYVERNFRPSGFWQIKRADVNFNGDNKLKNQKIRLPNDQGPGSARITWPENTISDLLSMENAEQ